MARWFSKVPKARAAAAGPDRLLLHRPSAATMEIALAVSRTIAFVHIGEAFSFVHEGWWLLGTPTGAVAISDQRPYVDLLLRDADLNAVAERIADKFVLDLMSRPWCMRGSASADGVALLTLSDLQRLRGKGVQTRVTHIRDFPRLL